MILLEIPEQVQDDCKIMGTRYKRAPSIFRDLKNMFFVIKRIENTHRRWGLSLSWKAYPGIGEANPARMILLEILEQVRDMYYLIDI